LKDIGYGVFLRCAALSSVRVPPRVAIPLEKHVFYGCENLDVSAIPFRHLLPGEYKFAEVERAANTFTHTYMNGLNLNYLLSFHEIGEPDPDHMGEKVDEADFERDLHEFFTGTSWVILDDSVPIPGIRERSGTCFLEAIVHDALKNLQVEMYCDDDEGEGLREYTDRYRCVDLINLRFIRLDSQWYAMLFEWYD
jgi:hypothetical protein